MTAATPAPEHGSPGTPDGRTCSGPADAATPGQAAYEAHVMAAPDDLNFREPDKLDDWEYPAWEAAAQAGHEALAAQQPHAADGNAPELRITDCSAHGDALHIQVNTGHNWLCAVALAAILAEYEPQPEPGIPLRSDAETCDMLRADLADAEALLARWPKCPAGCNCRTGIAEDADANECGCDGPCNGGPQPAPELADAMRETASRELVAAMAESRKVRAILTEVLGWFGDNGSGRYARVSGTILARAYAKAGLAVPEELRRYL